ncbi:MAG: hypothetical protein ACQGVK_19245 [Myxococcota bacterium]
MQSGTATAPDPFARLRDRVAAELAQTPSRAPARLTEAIVQRHGDAVVAVLFYGSCLRKDTHEGVLDFYVVVDSYREIYGPGWLAFVNAVLPPNVFYLEAEDDALGTLRTKYAVISRSDFDRTVGAGCLHPYVWARFAQPAQCTYARDETSREWAAGAVARAVVTLVQRLSVFLPAVKGVQRFSLAALWQDALRRTYGSEVRGESEETIRGHYLADPERYDAAGVEALQVLEAEGWLDEVHPRGHAVSVGMPAWRRLRARWRWRLMRPLNRAVAIVRLLKTSTTFGDWLPYALWKVERHGGPKIEPTPRQRAHPLIFGWPVILRLLLKKDLR